jgi:hypothetical protein
MRNTFNKAPAPSAPATPPGTTTGSPGNGTPGGGTPATRPPGTRRPGTRSFWAVAAISLLGLTGCNQIDPLKRPYMWHASNVNEQNIAAMAANPADLAYGRSSPQRRVSVESDGVTRLWTGKPLPLLSDTPGAASSGSSSGGGGAAAPSGGGT